MGRDPQTRLLDLLDHAYRVSDDLDAFDDLIKNAGQYLFSEPDAVTIAEDLPRYADIDPHIDRHITRLERLIADRGTQEKLGLSLDRHAQFILSTKGQVVSANPQAEALFNGPEGQFLDNLPLDLDSIDILRHLTKELRAGIQSVERIIYLRIEIDDPKPAFGFCRVVGLGDDAVGLQISLSYFEWSPAIFKSLKNALNLTDSEASVLKGVLLGQSQREIADARNRSVDTIKVQSKSILRKAGCAKMTDLAHLCTSIAYVIGLSDMVVPATSDGEHWVTPRQNLHTFKDTHDRTIAWYEYGDPDGRPVLYIHGFFQGPFFLDVMKRDLLSAGIRLIAPSRPFFGYTSEPIRHKDYPNTVSNDALALLEHLGIEGKLLIIAAHGGSNHAARIAHKLGDQAKGLVMIGARIPLMREHLVHMNQKTRTISAACRHAPSVMKMIATLGLKAYRERGIKDFLETQYAPSDIDRADVKNPMIFVKLSEGMFHFTQQGGDAFVYDGRAQMSDWTQDFDAIPCRQHWIHGRHCHVMGASLLKDFVTTRTNFPVDIIEDAGFNILYQKPEAVMDVIKSALDW